jgi:hypothetical protein
MREGWFIVAVEMGAADRPAYRRVVSLSGMYRLTVVALMAFAVALVGEGTFRSILGGAAAGLALFLATEDT